MRRPGIPAVKAGSALVYKIGKAIDGKQAWTAMECFAGERNLEGYGEFRITSLEEMQYDVSESAQTERREADLPEEVKRNRMDYSKKLLYPILSEKMLELLIAEYITDTLQKIRLNASTLERITLMLEESLNSGLDKEKAFVDFCERIASIRRKKEREEAFRFLKEIILKNEETKEIDFEKMEGGSEGALSDIKKISVQYLSEKKHQEILCSLWGKYLMTILTYHKYQKKHD